LVALEKYTLNDASLTYQKDSSIALGRVSAAAFSGSFTWRSCRSGWSASSISHIKTVPSVRYQFTLLDGTTVTVENPQYYPDPTLIKSSAEPFIRATIIIPERYMGAVMKLCLDRRGANPRTTYPTPARVEIAFDMPLAEVVFDFYDRRRRSLRDTAPLTTN